MKIFNLKFEQLIPVSNRNAWDFFSSPANLSLITPTHMNFSITSGINQNFKMYPGMIITYKVSPIKGLRLSWVTEITHVKDQEYFVDEQRFGPYAFWQHQHHFLEIPGGVKMTDDLYYALPFGILGRFANAIFVENELKSIFSYRNEKVKEIFGDYIAGSGA